MEKYTKYGEELIKLLDVHVEMNGKTVHVLSLNRELQVDYLIHNHFDFFRSKKCKLFRMESLYFIITKRGTKILFELNRAQVHFAGKYLLIDKPYYRHFILKSRQLGFTTFISLWNLDEIIFNMNKEAGTMAHTQSDAKEIFNRKVKYATNNFYPCLQEILETNQDRAGKVEFVYPDKSISSMTVTSSMAGRGATFHFFHISEIAKLFASYPERASEIYVSLLPALPLDAFCFTETTAQGFGEVRDRFMKQWGRRNLITPELSKVEEVAHFYNWTWDDTEMEQIQDIIPLLSMEICELDWDEYQKEHELTDRQLSYYYMKWVQMGGDFDRLRQEFPTTHLEAFLSSGTNYFSINKTAQFLDRCDENYKRYDYINDEFIESRSGDLIIYDEVRSGKNYVIGADVSEGLEGRDYTTACVMGFDKQIKALYRGYIEPDDFANLLKVLGKRFNYALLAVEFNKDGNWVNTELRNSNYPSIYMRTVIDDVTKETTKSYGWLTNKKNRDFMLGETKKWFNTATTVNCKPFLEELLTFVRDKRGKPQAASGKHDDVVICVCIAVAVLQGRTEKVEEVKTFSMLNAIFAK